MEKRIEEEETGLSSPNSAVSSVASGGKKSEREEPEIETTRGISDEEEVGDGSRKKLRLSKEQSAVLEESFKEHHTLNPVSRTAKSWLRLLNS